MVPGEFALGAQEITVTFAEPETRAPVRATVRTEPLALSGVVPEGAAGLHPFVAAEALVLTQSVEGETEGMAPGDSAVRTVRATIRGTSPIFIPRLLPLHAIAGVGSYADEPVVEERQ